MRKWTHIMVHHTAMGDTPACEAATIRTLHTAKGWKDVGYHFVVERLFGMPDRYWAVVARPLYMAGAHAGTNEWNQKAIGIAIVGDFSKAPPGFEQQEEAARLIRALCDVLGIPVDRKHIVGHGEHRATECPGKLFNMDYLVDRVRAVVV